MSKPNIITTPSGDRMVLIPFEEYERLVEAAEDAADARDIDEIKRRLATGEEELIPAEVVDRIIDGENKLRVCASDLIESHAIKSSNIKTV